MRFPFLKNALSNILQKPSTELYPAINKEVADGFRGKISFDADKCINCGMCIRVCAASSITRTVNKLEEGDEITFQFYMGSCTFCQMCVDFCGRKAIAMTKEYCMIAEDEEELMVRGTFIKKPPVKPAPPKPAPTPQPISAE
jgi:formate hydrogenlyase subunit 6/NADH:ubiquinone oxidoreductase subunit I